jgi:hypothetical protein
MTLGLYEELPIKGLPHPPIALPVFLIIEEAVRVAWTILRSESRSGFDLLNATEDEVTHELYEALYDRVFANRLVEGFNNELFAAIAREAKLRSYNGASLDKMPDFLIRLVGREVRIQSQDWLTVECKPVDSDHPAGQHYCDKGVIRYIKGDYAWTMTDALMVGYVKRGYAISPKLVDALNARRVEIPTLDGPSPCHSSSGTATSEVVHISQHGRAFNYVETGQSAPSITIRHLWLRRD